VSQSTIWRALKRSGYTMKNVSDGALGQPDHDVAQRGYSPSAGVEGKDVTA
jgi:hypothetical protein